MFMFGKLAAVAAAGAIGTLARYGLTGFIHKFNRSAFPWGTLAVNVAGCFLAGFLWTLFETRWPVSGRIRLLIFVGFMGAFTTFSSFIIETGEMVRSAEWIRATANVFLQNGLGFIALFLGAAFSRMITV